MNIVIVNGSPRPQGATAQMLHAIQHRLMEKENVQVQYYDLSRLHLQYCTGCNHCFAHGVCVMQEDLEQLATTIREADGVVLGSPTYCSNVSAQLKTLVDRGHLVIEQNLVGKYAVGVISYENFGGGTAGRILRRVLSYAGAQVSGMVVAKVPFAHKPVLDSAVTRRLHWVADRLYLDTLHRRSHPLQRLMHGVAFRVGIRPFVLKKGAAYQATQDSFRRRSLIR